MKRSLTEQQIIEVIDNVNNWDNNCPFKRQLKLDIKVRINDKEREDLEDE